MKDDVTTEWVQELEIYSNTGSYNWLGTTLQTINS